MPPITVTHGTEELWRGKRFCELTPDDITAEWMDLMVKRLLRELDRQMRQIEGANAPETGAERAANARALVSLERALENLSRMESQRAANRESKVTDNQEQAFEAFKRRMDQLLAAGSAREGD